MMTVLFEGRIGATQVDIIELIKIAERTTIAKIAFTSDETFELL